MNTSYADTVEENGKSYIKPLHVNLHMHSFSKEKARDIVAALNKAYETGYNDAKGEIREALGIDELIRELQN